MKTAEYERREGLVEFGDFSNKLLYEGLQAVKRRRWDWYLGPWPSTLESTHYGGSWLVVHYLIDHYRLRFANFLVRISRGTPWREAWRLEIPIDVENIGELMDPYFMEASYGLWTVPSDPPPESSFEPSKPSESDVFVLRAALHHHASNDLLSREERARAVEEDLRAALDLDPTNERARRLLAQLARAP